MFPYTLLQLRLEWGDGTALDFAAQELSAVGVTFEVAPEDLKRLAVRPVQACISVLHYASREYREVLLPAPDIFPEPESSNVPNAQLFRIESDDPILRKELLRLQQDYAAYTEKKLTLPESELTSAVTGNEYDSSFPESLEEWKAGETAIKCNWKEPLQSTEIAVRVCLPHEQEQFLKLPLADFLREYWTENGLSGHPITEEKITHVYFGSETCMELVPSAESLLKLICRCREENLAPVLCLPPVPERNLNRVKILLAAAGSMEILEELVLNDIGTGLMLLDMQEKGEIPKERFRITAGSLFDKRLKDPRLSLRFNGKKDAEACARSSADAPLYIEYLRKLGFTAVSREVCGYPFEITGPTVLYLPGYLTNISGYCTLYAVCRNGNRGIQETPEQCPHYCERNAFLYEKGLHLAGIGNSLRGCSMKELNDSNELNRLIASGVCRLVVRL